jgi:hypothetical protein
MSSLANPGIHSADEIALVASKFMAIVEHITNAEVKSSVRNGSSFDFSHEVLCQVVDNLLSNCRW